LLLLLLLLLLVLVLLRQRSKVGAEPAQGGQQTIRKAQVRATNSE
jgi:hypothetical protein